MKSRQPRKEGAILSEAIRAISGVDFATAFSATIAAITNSGPGNTQLIGPAGSYARLTDYVKVLLSFAMILGRLEVLTLLVLFTKSFWR